MISNLVLCSGCSRHFRLREATCPFCGAPSSQAGVRRRPAPLPVGASRSRRHAAGAAFLAGGAMVACASDFTSTESVADTDGGGLDGGGSGAGGRAAGGRASTGGRLINGTGGGIGTGGTAGAGSGGVAVGGAIGSGGVGGGHTCAGATNPTGVLCRTNQDCTAAGNGGFVGAFSGCYMSVPPRGCGNPAFQPQECTVDADCGDAGAVCQTIACGGHVCTAACDPASCNGLNSCVGGLCTPKRCDEAGAAPCATGFVCNPADPTASAVGCVPTHCTSGTDCQAGYDCSPSAPGNGCVRRACTLDADCACGYCVNGYCEATLGFCYQIVAMPYGCVWPDDELV